MFKQIQKDNLMNKLFRSVILLGAISLFATACGAQGIQAERGEGAVPKATTYEAVLGKSLSDKDVADFIASNNCSSGGPFQVCKETGMALWIDSSQIVKTVYLYSGNTDGFRRYKGTLPFGLSFYDPMWRVENKLRDLNAGNNLHQAGLPDEGSSPDHMHYWAVYTQLGMTVIYNSPFADEDAYIYAILVDN